ncbi:MAG TPA: hypothetical protein VIK60_10415 [Vicinamibacterales bacterium]
MFVFRWRTWLGIVLCLTSAPPLLAQEAQPSVLAIDTAASFDESVDFSGNYATGLSVDALVSVGLGRGLEGIVWPIVQRLGSGQWSRDVWIASVRYERAGPVGLRVEGGLVPSPVGLANFIGRRPHLNPTIAQPSSLFSALPQLETRGPRANLLGAVYPFGGQVTLSGRHWYGHAAMIDTSPLRRRRILSRTNPPRFTNVVVGGGVMPFVGLTIGASVTHGGWMRAGEIPTVTTDQDATVVTVESEFSFAHTRLSGEWVRDLIETSTGDRVAAGWFVQGQHTLAPRWFVAGRVEKISSPLVTPPLVLQQRLVGFEEVVGFRLTPEFTVRLGHRARRGFGRPGYDHQAAVSMVWWRRWI